MKKNNNRQLEHKRILFICPTSDLSAGGEKSNFELVKYLNSVEYDTHMCVPAEGELAEAARSIGVKVYITPYSWWDKVDHSTDSALSLVKIVEILSKNNIDAIITNTFNIPWGAMAAAATNTPHIWIGREFAENEFVYLENRMDFVKKNSNIVMANSAELKEYLRNTYSIPAKHFYSFVDVSGIKPGLLNAESRLISIGSVNNRKNQIDLIKAMGILKGADSSFNTKAIIIGWQDESYINQLKQIAQSEKVNNLIEFIEYTKDPWSLVSESDVLVQTSRSESIGRSITEAMKMGIPVIASDISGHREAFSLGGGLLYQLGDARDLAEKIANTIPLTENEKKKAAEIKSKVSRTMSLEACNTPFVNELQSIIGQPNPSKDKAFGTELLLSVTKIFSDETNNLKRVSAEQGARINQLEEDISRIVSSKRYKIGMVQAEVFNRIKEFLRRQGE